MAFRLQKVLDIKELAERQKEREFSEVTGRLQRATEELTAIENKIKAFVEVMNNSQAFEVKGLSDHHEYLLTLNKIAESKHSQIVDIGMELDEKRRELIDATKGKKVLLNLKEKHDRAVLEAARKREQEMLDEIAGFSSRRKNLISFETRLNQE